MNQIHKFEAKILSIEQVTPTVKTLRITAPVGFTYEPGQYLSLIVDVCGKPERRSYSIVQGGEEWVEICLSEVENGRVSPVLHSMKVDSKLTAQGPLGVFVLKPNAHEKENIFVATGTGVVPFVPMIRTLLQKTEENITLFVGYKNQTELLYDSVFKELEREYENFEYCIVLSRDDTYNGEKGHVQNLLEKYIPKDFEGDFYICGLFDMIKDVGQMLTKDWKASKERIIFERYD